MVPQNVALNSIFPIVTKLKLDAWEHALRDAGILGEYSDIPAGLRNGFLCGLENFSLTCTSIPDNHYTLKEDENFFITKYAEMDLGRISHGYDPVTLFSLIGHFRTAPLAVINHGGKQHVIVNHSFPRNKPHIDLDILPCINTHGKSPFDPTQTSINTVIDSKKFKCTWGSFSECYLLVADAPEGTQAAVFMLMWFFVISLYIHLHVHFWLLCSEDLST